jgi:hypothetical protein
MREAEGALYSHFSLAYFFTTACELSSDTSTKKWIESIPSWTVPIPWTTLLGFFQGLSTAAPHSTNGRQQKNGDARRQAAAIEGPKAMRIQWNKPCTRHLSCALGVFVMMPHCSEFRVLILDWSIQLPL